MGAAIKVICLHWGKYWQKRSAKILAQDSACQHGTRPVNWEHPRAAPLASEVSWIPENLADPEDTIGKGKTWNCDSTLLSGKVNNTLEMGKYAEKVGINNCYWLV